MQKKLLASAVLVAIALPAVAQSNVAIYGRASYGLLSRSGDSGAVPETNGKTEFVSGISGGSRIGFRGTEDLGNGLKAIFELEYQLDLDQGTTSATRWGNRHSWVGLSGNWGTVIGGRIDGLRYNSMFSKYDPFGVTFVGNISQLTPQRLDRYDNAVMYTSPSFGGFTGSLLYSSQPRGNEGTSSGSHGGNEGDNRAFAALVTYENGPLNVSANYEQAKTQGVDDNALRTWTLGASYDFKVAKLYALYDNLKAGDNNTVITGLGQEQSLWLVGVKAPVTANLDVRAVYGKTTYDKYDGSDAQDMDASKWGIGAEYKLSKRTKFYADYGSIHNDSNAANTLGYAGTHYLSDSGYGTRGFDLGIEHRF